MELSVKSISTEMKYLLTFVLREQGSKTNYYEMGPVVLDTPTQVKDIISQTLSNYRGFEIENVDVNPVQINRVIGHKFNVGEQK